MRIFITILCCLSLLPAVSLAEGKKYALLVGVETYDPTFLTRLSFAEDDAEELGKTFKELGFDVIVMTRSAEIPAQRPNTAEKILDQLSRRVKGLQAEDTLVVGFSGHGVQYKQPRKLKSGAEETHFFCPEEANLNNVDSLVSIAKVYELIQQCAAERKLLIVDACRNEVLSEIGKNAPEIELEPAGVTPRTVPKGMLALYSCTEGEKSYELPELKHGVFCYHVLKYLKGEADPKNYFRDQIGMGGLARYAATETRDYVSANLSRDQLPELMGRTSDWPLGLRVPRFIFPGKAAGDTRDDNGLKFKFVWCPPGEFKLDFGPHRAVTNTLSLRFKESSLPSASWSPLSKSSRIQFTKGFWLGRNKVTTSEFAMVMKRATKAEVDSNGNWPKVCNWTDARDFCEQLTFDERKAGRIGNQERYALPTLAQMRYALEAGQRTQYFWGNDASDVHRFVHVKFVESHPIGILRPNAWGLFDMLGNHSGQWCRDYLPKTGWADGIDAEIGRNEALVDRDGSRFRMLSGTVSADDGGAFGEYFEAGTEDCPYYTFRVALITDAANTAR